MLNSKILFCVWSGLVFKICLNNLQVVHNNSKICVLFLLITLLARAVEYADCISAEGEDYPNECPKQSDGEASVIMELSGMWSISSLPSLPGPLWLRVVAPDRVLSMGQMEQFDISTLYKQMTFAKLNCLKKNCLIIQL